MILYKICKYINKYFYWLILRLKNIKTKKNIDQTYLVGLLINLLKSIKNSNFKNKLKKKSVAETSKY